MKFNFTIVSFVSIKLLKKWKRFLIWNIYEIKINLMLKFLMI